MVPYREDVLDKLDKLSPNLGTEPRKVLDEAVSEIVMLRKFRDAVQASLRDDAVPFPDPLHFR